MKKLIVVAMLSTITLAVILFSCSDDDAVTPAPSNLVSGVFLGDTIPINDTTMLQVDLSVDELADGSVNGGLWVSWLYTTQLRERERVLHQLSLTHMPDGQTVHFNGTASITNPPGEVRISGSIISGSVIEDTVTFADGRVVVGTMNRRGPFLRPSDSKSTLDSVFDNVGTYPAVWIQYEPVPSGSGYLCGQDLPLGKLVVTSSTVNNVGTIDLEGKAYAWYSDCVPSLYQPGDTLSAVLPGDDPTNFEIKPWETSIIFDLDDGNICNFIGSPYWNPSEKILIINGMCGNCEDGCMGTLGPKE